MNLRTRTTRTCVSHLPEIIFFISVDNAFRRQELCPYGGGFVVALQPFGWRAFENCHVQSVFIKFQYVGKIFPCPFNGFFLKIIAERPVAQHLEHGMMIGVVTHFFQIIMLTAHTQTFL
ncbi:hypothetical protein SDC9_122798 [bioreactor metagenome]|uniref:Uncharacterized protein n=1 Tax=bioreactor metagenome TaxID=1076179 RepID=A0A645CFT9_9ZZZZ